MQALIQRIISVVVSDGAGISALVAVGVFAKSIYEYTRQNRLRRFEKYQDIAGQWDENKDVQAVRLLIDSQEYRKLAETSPDTRQNFIHCYEDLALMRENGLISERVAFYMFGFYAIRAYESEEFWKDLKKNDPFYTLFCRFSARMQEIEQLTRRRGLRGWKFKL
jgi:hypothetical protein